MDPRKLRYVSPPKSRTAEVRVGYALDKTSPSVAWMRMLTLSTGECWYFRANLSEEQRRAWKPGKGEVYGVCWREVVL